MNISEIYDLFLIFFTETTLQMYFLFFLFSRSFLGIEKRRNDACISTPNCHISKAWSQTMTELRDVPRNCPSPLQGLNWTKRLFKWTQGPKAGSRSCWNTIHFTPQSVMKSRSNVLFLFFFFQWAKTTNSWSNVTL